MALNDIGKIQDAVLALGEFKGKPNQSRLYTDIRDLMAKYGMNVIDSGVPVLSMHAPWEIISKADLYEALKGYIAFLNA